MSTAGAAGPIVVGYHADASGHDALALAVRLARALGEPLVVAKIYPDPAPIGIGRVDVEWVSDRKAASTAVLDDARRRLAATTGSRVDPPEASYRLVPSTSAARGLSDLAVELDAAVIVVGSAETEGYARGHVLAGSTAGRLLSGAERSVAIAPHGYAERPVAEGVLRVAVAHQDTPESRLAADVAAGVVARAGGSLTLVTSLDADSSTIPWSVGGQDAQDALVATTRESFQSSLDSEAIRLAGATGRAPQTHLLIGDVVDTLADVDADLLFVGSRGYGPVRMVLLGGLSSRLVRRARMPLVITPRP